MKSNKTCSVSFRLLLCVFVVFFIFQSNAFALSNQITEEAGYNNTEDIALTDELLKDSVFVSDLQYGEAVLNCNLPECFKDKYFTVVYQYWKDAEPANVQSTTLYRTYTPSDYKSFDSQWVYGISPDEKYSFKAIVTVIEKDKKVVLYSNTAQFVGYASSIPPPNNFRVYGYVAPDFQLNVDGQQDGFTVTINGGSARTTTVHSNGLFYLYVSKSKNVYYKISISKPGYLSREIDLGHLSSRDTRLAQNGAYNTILCGDINNDNSINIMDIMIMAQSFNTSEESDGYNKNIDYNGDGAINITDILLVAKNFNKSSESYDSLPQVPYIELKSHSGTGDYVQPGRTVTFDLMAHNIENIAAYHANISYDPTVLEPVNYSDHTKAASGDLLVNEEFFPVDLANNDLSKGILNFSRFYIYLNTYKNSGCGDSTGKLASITFKALKDSNASTIIRLSPCTTMPDGISGTIAYDWNGNKISDYMVIQPEISVHQYIYDYPQY